MLSVARDPFLQVRQRTNKKKKKGRRRRRRRRREKKREKTRREEVSIDLRANPLPREKVNGKKGMKKKNRRERGTPESDENVPGDREFLDATIYPLDRRTTEGAGGGGAPRKWPRVFGMGWKGRIDGIARESFITIPSILRFAASRCDREQLSIGLKGSPVCKLWSFPEEKLVDLGWQRAKKGEKRRCRV